MSTPQSLGTEAKAGRLSPDMPAIRDLRQPQTCRRSCVVLAWPFKVLTLLQHGWEGDGPGFDTCGRHGVKVCATAGHEGAALASGMPKTKHIIANQVTLISIELAMIWKFW